MLLQCCSCGIGVCIVDIYVLHRGLAGTVGRRRKMCLSDSLVTVCGRLALFCGCGPPPLVPRRCPPQPGRGRVARGFPLCARVVGQCFFFELRTADRRASLQVASPGALTAAATPAGASEPAKRVVRFPPSQTENQSQGGPHKPQATNKHSDAAELALQ